MSEWTPGPWKAHWNAKDSAEIVGKRYEVALLNGYVGEAELKANARLIAVAPDMYEALNKMAQFRRDYSYAPGDWVLQIGEYEHILDPICDDIEAALEIATGDSDD